MIIVININIIILRIIIVITISVIITIFFLFYLFIYLLFIYSFINIIIFFYILLCQQGNSPCIIVMYNGGSKARFRLSGRGRSCLVYTKPGMLGLGIVPNEIHSRLFNPVPN